MAKSDTKGKSKASAKAIPYQDPHAVRDVRVNNLEMAIGHEVRAYRKKLVAHRDEIAEAARRVGWSFLVHHTDRPAAEPLLTLIMRLQGVSSDYRWRTEAQAARQAPGPSAGEPG